MFEIFTHISKTIEKSCHELSTLYKLHYTSLHKFMHVSIYGHIAMYCNVQCSYPFLLVYDTLYCAVDIHHNKTVQKLVVMHVDTLLVLEQPHTSITTCIHKYVYIIYECTHIRSLILYMVNSFNWHILANLTTIQNNKQLTSLFPST